MTDPLAFLLRLHHKSQYRDGRARSLLARLSEDLSTRLGWDVAGHLGQPGDLLRRWHATPAALRTPAVVIVDIARHAYDAADRSADPDPLQQPGLVLLAGVDRWASGVGLNRFLELLDARFPNLQFVITLSAQSRRRLPTHLTRKRLPIPEAEPRPPRAPVRRLARATGPSAS